MESEVVRLKREQMLRDGYCVIEEVVPEQFLEELHAETESWIADHEEPDDLVYQGQHIVVHRDDNPLIDRLLCWEPAYAAARALGFGDFTPHGAIIPLTQAPTGPPLTGTRTGCGGTTPCPCPRGRRRSSSTFT